MRALRLARKPLQWKNQSINVKLVSFCWTLTPMKITPVYKSVQKMYWKKFRPNCRTWEPHWQENWQNGAKSNQEMLKLLDFVRKMFRIIWRAKLPAVIETIDRLTIEIIYSQGKGTQSFGTTTATSCCLELQVFCQSKVFISCVGPLCLPLWCPSKHPWSPWILVFFLVKMFSHCPLNVDSQWGKHPLVRLSCSYCLRWSEVRIIVLNIFASLLFYLFILRIHNYLSGLLDFA